MTRTGRVERVLSPDGKSACMIIAHDVNLVTPQGNSHIDPCTERLAVMDLGLHGESLQSVLIEHTVEEATANAAGALQVIFEGGARLTVEPDPAYEAWNVSGPDGALVVSTAGGKLAIWKSQSNADESTET
jgi:hypothetical protein